MDAMPPMSACSAEYARSLLRDMKGTTAPSIVSAHGELKSPQTTIGEPVRAASQAWTPSCVPTFRRIPRAMVGMWSPAIEKGLLGDSTVAQMTNLRSRDSGTLAGA